MRCSYNGLEINNNLNVGDIYEQRDGSVRKIVKLTVSPCSFSKKTKKFGTIYVHYVVVKPVKNTVSFSGKVRMSSFLVMTVKKLPYMIDNNALPEA